jgi:hypothetical protein
MGTPGPVLRRSVHARTGPGLILKATQCIFQEFHDLFKNNNLWIPGKVCKRKLRSCEIRDNGNRNQNKFKKWEVNSRGSALQAEKSPGKDKLPGLVTKVGMVAVPLRYRDYARNDPFMQVKTT